MGHEFCSKICKNLAMSSQLYQVCIFRASHDRNSYWFWIKTSRSAFIELFARKIRFNVFYNRTLANDFHLTFRMPIFTSIQGWIKTKYGKLEIISILTVYGYNSRLLSKNCVTLRYDWPRHDRGINANYFYRRKHTKSTNWVRILN